MGISFGILQWNFGQGTLAPMLLRMNERDPAKFRAIFGADTDHFLALLKQDKKAQMQFAIGINDNHNHVIEPWHTRFSQLGEVPAFQEVEVEFAAGEFETAKKLCREFG